MRVRLHTGSVFWLALCLLVQSVVLTHHAVAMAAGAEVCSAQGSKRVDADGKAVPDAARHDHDCECCSVSVAAPPADGVSREPLAAQPTRTALVTAGGLCAPWLAPLSRGPPHARPS